MTNATPTPPRSPLAGRLIVGAVLAGLALVGLPGRLVLPGGTRDTPEGFLLAPGPIAVALVAGTTVLLLGALVVSILLEPAEPGLRATLGSVPLLHVPLTLPASVASLAPGSLAVRLTYHPTLPGWQGDAPVGRGLPVMAPAAGIVIRAVDGEPEGQRPAEWCNNVLLRLDAGGYVRIGGLALGSVAVRPGQHVPAGALLGGCGCVAGSPAAGLLMQFQDGPDEGAPARPFRFAGFIEFAPAGPRWIEEAPPGEGTVIRGVRPMGLA